MYKFIELLKGETTNMPNMPKCAQNGSSDFRFTAFSLAEMMVVMLIMSIVLAAMAPMVTTRIKADEALKASGIASGGDSDNNEPWKWVENSDSDAYSEASRNMIGQTEAEEDDGDAMLIINTGDVSKDDILLKSKPKDSGEGTLGRIRLFGDYLLIGTTLTDLSEENHALSIGFNNEMPSKYRDSSMPSKSVYSNNAIALGYENCVAGSNAVAIGNNNTTGSKSTYFDGSALYRDCPNAVAVGYQNNMAGYATAVGNQNKASFTYATAIGSQNNAKNTYTLAVGSQNNASYTYATAIGNQNNAGHIYTLAVGYQNEATYKYASAVGYQNKASDENATAIGNQNNAEKQYATAIGWKNTASGYTAKSATHTEVSSVAVGFTNTVSAGGSSAFGVRNTVSTADSTAVGFYNSISSTAITATAVVVGNNNTVSGSGSGIISGLSNKVSSGGNIIYGSSNNISGKGSTVVGVANSIKSASTQAMVFGYRNEIEYANPNGDALDLPIAIGESNTVSTHTSSVIGYDNEVRAEGPYSTTIGYQNRTYGDSSTCIGKQNFIYSTALCSTALGFGNKANGERSVAIGYDARTAGLYDVAVGGAAYISGSTEGSVAIGELAMVTNASYAVALGYNAKATAKYDFVLGCSSHNVKIPGSLTVNGTAVTSDKRLKYIKGENKSGLDAVRKMKVYNFTFKKDKNKEPRVGVIAQELQKILPDAVKKGSDGFLTIRIDDIIYTLVNAVKELDRKVSELTETLKQVQAEQKRINQRLDALERK